MHLTRALHVHLTYTSRAQVESGSQRAVSLLLRYGASTTSVNSLGTTPLHSSVSRGELGVVRLLLEAGADPCVRERSPMRVPVGPAVVERKDASSTGATATATATGAGAGAGAEAGAGATTGQLLGVGKEAGGPDACADCGTTPLHLAAEEEDPALIQVLLEFGAGASMGVEDNDGCTALQVAVDCGADECAALLLSHKQQQVGGSTKVHSTKVHSTKVPPPLPPNSKAGR
jgi:ankyrin repeat protein